MTMAAPDTAAPSPLQAGASGAPLAVMHVITSLDVGGAETMLAQLVSRDSAGSISHSVVGLKRGGALRAGLGEKGIPVGGLDVRGNVGALGGLLRLAGLIKTTRPAVVHSWLYHADLLATLALALSGRRKATRLVWGIRCSDMDVRRYARSTRYTLKLLRFLSSRTDLVLCNSEAGRAAHERLGYRPPRWRVVRTGSTWSAFGHSLTSARRSGRIGAERRELRRRHVRPCRPDEGPREFREGIRHLRRGRA